MASGIKRKQDDDASDSWSGKGPGSDLQTSPDCKSVSNMAEPCRPVPRRWEPNPHLDAYFRNLYTSEPDFKKLAVQDPDFATYVQNGRLNFTDPDAMMQLTKTLLKVDFGLRIDLPRDRLCPPVPNRHNYILWIKDLMDSTSYEQPGRPLCGLDVGTGASCIYPLLGTAQRPWSFIATDIDVKNIQYARKNIEINRLQDRIRVLERKPEDKLVPIGEIGIESVDFVMMNPPFYSSEDDMLESAKRKSRPPMSACTGARVEMVCDGGEVAHVCRLLSESLILRERVSWYTSMLGKLSSLEILVEKLRTHGIDNYAVTEFIQGTKTRRWALGWSFGPMRPAENAARGMKSSAGRKLLPPPVTAKLLVSSTDRSIGRVVTRIQEVLGSLELLSWSWEPESLRGFGRARENVWGRAWRRKKLHEQHAREDTSKQCSASAAKPEECRLGFGIEVLVCRSEACVTLLWREGHDFALFESLGGYLRGKLKDLG